MDDLRLSLWDSRHAGGFTLVEVIIAAVILFSALSVGTLAHRASIRTIEKSAAIIAVSDALPSVMERIKPSLFDNKDSGTGQFGKEITYEWSAVETRSSPDILGEFNEATGGLEYGRFRVSMKTVTLKLTYTRFGREQVFPYEYQELVWTLLNQPPAVGGTFPRAGIRVSP